MVANEWNCAKCTFHHKFNATRCSMCGELRTTREQMRDFVMGKGLPNREKRSGSGGKKGENLSSNCSHVSNDQKQVIREKPLSGGHLGGGDKSGGGGELIVKKNVAISNPYAKKNPYDKKKANSVSSGLSSVDAVDAGTTSMSISTTCSSTITTSRLNSHKQQKQEHQQNRVSSTKQNPYAKQKQQPQPQEAKQNQLNHFPIQNMNKPIHGIQNKVESNPSINDMNASSSTIAQNGSNVQNETYDTTGPSHQYEVSSLGQNLQQDERQHPVNSNPVTSDYQKQEIQSLKVASSSKSLNISTITTSSSLPIPINGNIKNVATSQSASVLNNESSNTSKKLSSSFACENKLSCDPLQYAQDSKSITDDINNIHSANCMKPIHKTNSQIKQQLNQQQRRTMISTSKPSENPFTMASRASSSQSSILKEYQPGPIPLAPGNITKTWIYPKSTKYEEREYQLTISYSAIMQNTLVSLPTGLGKTLIAAVVMYNFYTWFPTGKVIFLAPTRPLVTQQIEACYNIMGISEHHTAEMSGRSKPSSRTELWKTRRVFFCTPQTLQKDIEEGRCCARSVVCVVLDEAHKATGKYAYGKVVNLMEEAGAKFRVVGLSATPGKNIENVRKVIETLRISKVEARMEDDPTVKQYIHERHNEVIIVQPPSQVAAAEKLFAKVLNPLLDILRERGGLVKFRGGNSTVSSYNAMMDMKENQIFAADRGLVPYSLVIQSLLRAREALRENGVGLARTKLAAFMRDHGCKRGIGLNISKSKAYQELWATVVEAHNTGKTPSQVVPADLKLNNPKLEKLDEILIQHFERARACGESSRAIVFSQWRDSVEEIVQVLKGSKPLVQAKKFVGQSTGTTADEMESGDTASSSITKSKKRTSSKVAGMNQKEQQRVIREFRIGIHNVLVCTCIGEEGLDIGEVDLIVNYDCLRSPIRMVQRTGRTGRKRNGRVVCLVLKGQEEKKLQQSELATKTLWKALSNSKAFSLAKNIPLLPEQPSLTRKNMYISSAYRLSQVGGHVSKQSKLSKRKVHIGDTKVDDESWRLTDIQEGERQKLFGIIDSFDEDMLKRSIKSWQAPFFERHNQKVKRACGYGISCRILRDVEAFCQEKNRFKDSAKAQRNFISKALDNAADDNRTRLFMTTKNKSEMQQSSDFSSNVLGTSADTCGNEPAVCSETDGDPDDGSRQEDTNRNVSNRDEKNSSYLDSIFGSVYKPSPSTKVERLMYNVIFDLDDDITKSAVSAPPRFDCASGMYIADDNGSNISRNEESSLEDPSTLSEVKKSNSDESEDDEELFAFFDRQKQIESPSFKVSQREPLGDIQNDIHISQLHNDDHFEHTFNESSQGSKPEEHTSTGCRAEFDGSRKEPMGDVANASNNENVINNEDSSPKSKVKEDGSINNIVELDDKSETFEKKPTVNLQSVFEDENIFDDQEFSQRNISEQSASTEKKVQLDDKNEVFGVFELPTQDDSSSSSHSYEVSECGHEQPHPEICNEIETVIQEGNDKVDIQINKNSSTEESIIGITNKIPMIIPAIGDKPNGDLNANGLLEEHEYDKERVSPKNDAALEVEDKRLLLTENDIVEISVSQKEGKTAATSIPVCFIKLPTQESSSDDDGSDDKEDEGDEEISKPSAIIEGSVFPSNLNGKNRDNTYKVEMDTANMKPLVEVDFRGEEPRNDFEPCKQNCSHGNESTNASTECNIEMKSPLRRSEGYGDEADKVLPAVFTKGRNSKSGNIVLSQNHSELHSSVEHAISHRKTTQVNDGNFCNGQSKQNIDLAENHLSCDLSNTPKKMSEVKMTSTVSDHVITRCGIYSDLEDTPVKTTSPSDEILGKEPTKLIIEHDLESTQSPLSQWQNNHASATQNLTPLVTKGISSKSRKVLLTQKHSESPAATGSASLDVEMTPIKDSSVNSMINHSVYDLTDTPTKSSEAKMKSAEPGYSDMKRDINSDLEDTPIKVYNSQEAGKSNPQTAVHDDMLDDSEDILCAICLSGDSPDEDPIVLCDGPSDNKSCPFAVHKSCYHIDICLDSTEFWRCDVCMQLKTGNNKAQSGPKCCICFQSKGPMKVIKNSVVELQEQSMWIHPLCLYWSPSYVKNIEPDKIPEHAFNGSILSSETIKGKNSGFFNDLLCQFCGGPNAVKCAYPSCTESAHPHCAINLPPKDNRWTLIHGYNECVDGGNIDFSTVSWSQFCTGHSLQATSVIALHGIKEKNASSMLGACIDLRNKRRQTLVHISSVKERKKRLRKITESKNPKRKHCRFDIPKVSKDEKIKKIGIRRRFDAAECKFLDISAIASDSDEDDEVEDFELSQDSFINDSSQLGYTQDQLDCISKSDNYKSLGNMSVSPASEGVMHRRLDNRKVFDELYATPILNRLSKKRSKTEVNMDTDVNGTLSSTQSSEKGLGKMNFIRSVIEHHRKGGSANELEEGYHSFIANQKNADRKASSWNEYNQVRNRLVLGDDSDSGTEDYNPKAKFSLKTSDTRRYPNSNTQMPPPPSIKDNANGNLTTTTRAKCLTAEQKARIEANRREALRRREERMKKQLT